jgi:hypothetical protein
MGCIAPELDQPGLFRVKFQAELCQPFLELFKESNCFGSITAEKERVDALLLTGLVTFRVVGKTEVILAQNP